MISINVRNDININTDNNAMQRMLAQKYHSMHCMPRLLHVSVPIGIQYIR